MGKQILCMGLIVVLLLSVAFASALPCITDVHCTSLGANYACDTAENECVEIDLPAALTGQAAAQPEPESLSPETPSAAAQSPELTDTLATTPTTTSPAISLNNRIQGLETQLSVLTSRIEQLEGGVDRLDTNLDEVSQGQEAIESQIEGQLNTVSVGLASLQQNIASVEEEIAAQERKAARTRFLILIVIALVTFAVLSYLIVMHQMRSRVSQKLDPEVREYVSSQIKRGIPKTQITSALVTQGWSVEQADFAYKKTAFENYHDYEKSTGKHHDQTVKAKRLQEHHSRMLVVSIITFAIIAILLLVVRNSTGQAISTTQLPHFVEEKLTHALESNPSYSSVDFAEACFSSSYQGQSLHYVLLKTPSDSLIRSVETCDGIYDLEKEFSTLDDLLLCVGAMPLDQLAEC